MQLTFGAHVWDSSFCSIILRSRSPGEWVHRRVHGEFARVPLVLRVRAAEATQLLRAFDPPEALVRRHNKEGTGQSEVYPERFSRQNRG